MFHHFVVDVFADEVIDVAAVGVAAHIGVGHPVLNGAQVHMRQRRLERGGDDAGNAGKLVGQRLVDHHVPGVGTLLQVHDPQKAVPFRLVQRDEITFLGSEVFVEHEVDSGCLVGRQLVPVSRKVIVSHVIGQVVLEQRHAGGEHRMGEIHSAEGLSVIELVRVESWTAVRGKEFRDILQVTAEPPRHVRIDAYSRQEVKMADVRIGVLEVDTRSVGVRAEYSELD